MKIANSMDLVNRGLSDEAAGKTRCVFDAGCSIMIPSPKGYNAKASLTRVQGGLPADLSLELLPNPKTPPEMDKADPVNSIHRTKICA